MKVELKDNEVTVFLLHDLDTGCIGFGSNSMKGAKIAAEWEGDTSAPCIFFHSGFNRKVTPVESCEV